MPKIYLGFIDTFIGKDKITMTASSQFPPQPPIENEQQPLSPPLQGTGSPSVLPGEQPPTVQKQEPPFYLIEDEKDDSSLFGAHTVAPFQLSQSMPPVQEQKAPSYPPSQGHAPVTPKKKQRKIPLLLLAGLTTLVAVLVLTFVMTAFAAPAPPTATMPGVGQTQPPAHATSTMPPRPTQGKQPSPTPAPKKTQPPTPPAQTSPSWVPGVLPDGWRQAGLSTGDAVFALRTALTFTDREEGIDYRNVGARTAHGGTLTAGTFLLTLAAKERFQANDVRVANNALFGRVAQQQLIQAGVDMTPRLIKFQIQGQQQFAWIDVSFHLWQSRLDPNNPQKRLEAVETDPATALPRLHHMVVLLLNVGIAQQNSNSPMNGSGWLVSVYGLDTGSPDIIQPA